MTPASLSCVPIEGIVTVGAGVGGVKSGVTLTMLEVAVDVPESGAAAGGGANGAGGMTVAACVGNFGARPAEFGKVEIESSGFAAVTAGALVLGPMVMIGVTAVKAPSLFTASGVGGTGAGGVTGWTVFETTGAVGGIGGTATGVTSTGTTGVVATGGTTTADGRGDAGTLDAGSTGSGTDGVAVRASGVWIAGGGNAALTVESGETSVCGLNGEIFAGGAAAVAFA